MAEKRPATEGPDPRTPLDELFRALSAGRQVVHALALLLWVAAALALVAGTAVLAVAVLVVIALNALFASAAGALAVLLPSWAPAPPRPVPGPVTAEKIFDSSIEIYLRLVT